MKRFISVFFIIFFLVFCSTLRVSSAQNISGEIINVNYKYKIAFTDLSATHLHVGDIVEVRKGGLMVTYLEVSQASGAISKLVPIKRRGRYKTEVDFNEIGVGSEIFKVEDLSLKRKKQTLPVEKKSKIVYEEYRDESDAVDSRLLIESLAPDIQDKIDIQGQQIQKLIENYVILSNNLVELMDEKRVLEIKSAQIKVKFEVTQKRLREAEIRNTMLEEENKELKKKFGKRVGNKSQKKIKELEQTISKLRKKLKRMVQIIQGNLK